MIRFFACLLKIYINYISIYPFIKTFESSQNINCGIPTFGKPVVSVSKKRNFLDSLLLSDSGNVFFLICSTDLSIAYIYKVLKNLFAKILILFTNCENTRPFTPSAPICAFGLTGGYSQARPPALETAII